MVVPVIFNSQPILTKTIGGAFGVFESPLDRRPDARAREGDVGRRHACQRQASQNKAAARDHDALPSANLVAENETAGHEKLPKTSERLHPRAAILEVR